MSGEPSDDDELRAGRPNGPSRKTNNQGFPACNAVGSKDFEAQPRAGLRLDCFPASGGR
jgi:hypothetical protein